MERLSLFNELKKGGYETCLATSYNIDFPFYEEVLLRRMKAAGIHHHVLLLDNNMCLQAIKDRPPTMAGRHYTLAPLHCPGAFHPKLLVLLGKSKGLIAIGSHNLTLSGFGTNLEITNVVRFNKNTSDDETILFNTAINAFKQWLKDYGNHLPMEIAESLSKLETLYPWLTKDPSDASNYELLFTSQNTPPLWDQLLPYLPEKLDKVVGISPFFDKSLAFLSTLEERCIAKMSIGIQSGYVQGPKELANSANINLYESACLNQNKEGQSSYIHAKVLFLESKKQKLLISGSANFSAPAWLDTQRRNAEAVLLRRDESIGNIFNDLGFNKIENSPVIDTFTNRQIESQQVLNSRLSIIIAAYIQGGNLKIYINQEWTDRLIVAYEDQYGDILPIEINIYDNHIIISPSALTRPGEPLSIFQDDNLVAKVIIHDVLLIQEYSSTGSERKLRQAMGSLTTDSPDISLLFECMAKLTPDLSGTRKHENRSISKKKSKGANESTPDSLITEISEHVLSTSGNRSRLRGQDDIGLILDTLLSNIKLEQQETQEEIEQEGLDVYQSPHVITEKEDDPIQEHPTLTTSDLSLLCQSKIKDTIRKIENYLDATGTSGIPAALSVVIICYELFRLRGHQQYITTGQLADLFSVFCKTILDDKDPFFDDSLDDDIYKSEEWGQLLGYVTWLAYYAGVNLHSKPPISCSLEDRNTYTWANACWLYLNQHLCHNEEARLKASELVSTLADEHLSLWFISINQPFAGINSTNISKQLKGYRLATVPSSSKKGFPGYRLVVSADERISLARITAPGEYSQYGLGFLSIS